MLVRIVLLSIERAYDLAINVHANLGIDGISSASRRHCCLVIVYNITQGIAIACAQY